ncbi:hypothetical protein RBSWK_00633 [Rhodopirellula baltica SWK14]|uniref:Uncharacterized protein n=1 Tax=Rhodopirellula baltica SWK14 TaxID=993516 RepID=L7CNV0_RHOBT|nr:hypothetical protein RBSWK_00633 [Rhodopirellula baltica SWK14]
MDEEQVERATTTKQREFVRLVAWTAAEPSLTIATDRSKSLIGLEMRSGLGTHR